MNKKISILTQKAILPHHKSKYHTTIGDVTCCRYRIVDSKGMLHTRSCTLDLLKKFLYKRVQSITSTTQCGSAYLKVRLWGEDFRNWCLRLCMDTQWWYGEYKILRKLCMKHCGEYHNTEEILPRVNSKSWQSSWRNDKWSQRNETVCSWLNIHYSSEGFWSCVRKTISASLWLCPLQLILWKPVFSETTAVSSVKFHTIYTAVYIPHLN